MPEDIRPIDHEEFNKNLKRLFNAPPLKLKDLKKKEKKKMTKKNLRIKKVSSSFLGLV